MRALLLPLLLMPLVAIAQEPGVPKGELSKHTFAKPIKPAPPKL